MAHVRRPNKVYIFFFKGTPDIELFAVGCGYHGRVARCVQQFSGLQPLQDGARLSASQRETSGIQRGAGHLYADTTKSSEFYAIEGRIY